MCATRAPTCWSLKPRAARSRVIVYPVPSGAGKQACIRRLRLNFRVVSDPPGTMPSPRENLATCRHYVTYPTGDQAPELGFMWGANPLFPTGNFWRISGLFPVENEGATTHRLGPQHSGLSAIRLKTAAFRWSRPLGKMSCRDHAEPAALRHQRPSTTRSARRFQCC
jgi:hypothetical protein